MTIIPAIDIIDGKCVRLTKGDYSQKIIYNEDPLEVALQFEDAGIKRLHLVDLDGAKAGDVKNWKVLEKLAGKTRLVIDFSGGISSEKNLAITFNSGAAYAAVGSIAVKDEFTLSGWLLAYGAEKFIIGADVKDEVIVIKGWTEKTALTVFDLIETYKLKGVKKIFCTDVGKDGMMQGPATDLYKKIMNQHPSIDLIASGGISRINDLDELREAGCDGAIIGKAIYENKITLKELKKVPVIEMLTKRIIPCLDIKDGRTVKGTNFVQLRDAGDPVELALRYCEEGADELVFLDITATTENRKTLARLIREIATHINIPFTVGGGINTIDDVSILLENGADKISINTSAVKRPALIDELAKNFGSQCVVVAIDARLIHHQWMVVTHGGRNSTMLFTRDWAKEVTARGAGEILLTSMEHDGTKGGFAIELTKEIANSVSVPVIASGGAGNMEHFADVFKKANADAALAASIFHFKEIAIPDLKKYLADTKIPVRL